MLGEEQVAVVSDMCMHMLHVHVHAHAHCDVWAGAAWADLLYSLLYIPLYRKLLYKAKNRCIRRYTRTRIASRPSIAIQLYSAIHYTAIHRYTLYNLYNTPLCSAPGRPTEPTDRGGEPSALIPSNCVKRTPCACIKMA